MKSLVFFVATILVASQCQGSFYDTFPIQMKRGKSVAALKSDDDYEVKCASWRLAVEARNIIGFATVPEACEEPNAKYISGEQFRSDSKVANQQAYFYARTVTVRENDIWIFSIDGTALSNLPYYAEHGYGTELYNATLYDEWVLQGEAPTLPETLKNYNNILGLGFKIVFLSGRTEDKREVTIENLKKAGFDSWHQLILKDPENGQNAQAYKSTQRRQLEQNGYRIVGNVGDQWSDLLGYNKGIRTFKLPNPLYYIA